MLEFTDFHDRKVTLEFETSDDAGHILAICKMDDQYLLTRHRVRGIEFAGGKVEEGESMEEAVHREVFEETGASLEHLKYVGFYTVHGAEPFVKAVYFATVKDIFFKCEYEYMETLGPVAVRSVEEVPEADRSILLNDPCIHHLYQLSKDDEFFQ